MDGMEQCMQFYPIYKFSGDIGTDGSIGSDSKMMFVLRFYLSLQHFQGCHHPVRGGTGGSSKFIK